MLQQTFLDRSWRVLIIEEHDRRLVGSHPRPGETDWQDYPTVVQRLRRIPFEVVAAKPLVESDRAVELMDAAEPVKAIWMLRHYMGVARSNLRRFGADNPYRDLEPFCNGDLLDWRCRGAAKETRETLIGLMNENLLPRSTRLRCFGGLETSSTSNSIFGVMNGFGSSATSEPAIAPRKWWKRFPTTSRSGYPSPPLPPRYVGPDGSEAMDLHPDVERLCRKTWDSSRDVRSCRRNERLMRPRWSPFRTEFIRSTRYEALASASLGMPATMGARVGAEMGSRGSVPPVADGSRDVLRTSHET